jgi:hypothetical protein
MKEIIAINKEKLPLNSKLNSKSKNILDSKHMMQHKE